jgi:hypothetical protein
VPKHAWRKQRSPGGYENAAANFSNLGSAGGIQFAPVAPRLDRARAPRIANDRDDLNVKRKKKKKKKKTEEAARLPPRSMTSARSIKSTRDLRDIIVEQRDARCVPRDIDSRGFD